MTEADWLAGTNRHVLLGFVQERRLLSEARRRLFACSCCRRLTRLFDDRASLLAVEAAEQFAVGAIGAKRLSRAWREAQDTARAQEQSTDWSYWEPRTPRAFALAARAAAETAVDSEAFATLSPWQTAADAMFWHARDVARRAQAPRGGRNWQRAVVSYSFDDGEANPPAPDSSEVSAQCALLREVVGNPFRPWSVDPVWLRWNNGCLRKMARLMFDADRYDELPILGDALEEAGCRDEGVLAHCHGSEEHVRGCWVINRLLGIT